MQDALFETLFGPIPRRVLHTCERCGGSAYVWQPGPDGRDWLCDCDADDCDAWDSAEEEGDCEP